MIRKTLANGLLILAGMAVANLASALSLGELELKSSLNEPFQASIPFKDAADLSDSQIIARLASVEDFENAGVEFAYFLNELRFRVRVDGRGSGVIEVSTQDPIVEPYLDFLIEARWPSGRMLREYTVLLDLPAMTEGRTAAVEVARGGVATQAATAAPEATTTTVTETVEVMEPAADAASGGISPRSGDARTRLPATGTDTEYRVQHDDTLWEIAVRFRPSADVSVQQTMLALLRSNPEAFIDGNVNRLKSGYVLRLPSEDDAAAVTGDQAIEEVSRQNAAWQGKATGEAAAAPQMMASEKLESQEAPEEVAVDQARLSIATPGDSDTEGAAGAEAGAMRDALALSQENLEKANRDNQELSSRIDDLESQLSTLQRLLQLKDDQLAALQAGAQPVEQEGLPVESEQPVEPEEVMPEQPVETMAESDAEAVDAEQMVEAEAAEAVAGEQEMAGEPEMEMAAEPAVEPEPMEAPAETPIDEMLDSDRPLLTNIALAVAVVLVLLLLMRFLKQRREAKEAEEAVIASHLDEIASGELDTDEEAALAPEGEAVAEPEAEAEELTELEQALEAEPAAEEEAALSAEEMLDLGAEPEAEPEAPVQAETGDAIAEADIYVAYGRYDQAAELLKSAIAGEPQRGDLRAKLLAVYLETRDKDNFLAEYEALEGIGDDEALSQVRDSMSAVEGVSDWLREEGAVDQEFSLDTDLGGGDAGAEEEEISFDLDLDETLLGGDTDFEAEESAEPELDISEDLDLSLDEELSAEPESEEPAGLEEALELDESLVDEAAGLDFDLDEGLEPEAERVAEAEPAAPEAAEPELSAEPAEEESDLSFDLDLDELGKDLDLEGDFPSLEEEGLEELEPTLDVEETPAAEQPAPAAEPESTETAFEEFAAGGEDMDDFGLLGDSDEVSTKLDLARAYIDMGDNEGAREMLQEVLQEGDDTQKQEASSLLERL